MYLLILSAIFESDGHLACFRFYDASIDFRGFTKRGESCILILRGLCILPIL